jgi:hypothetical protein
MKNILYLILAVGGLIWMIQAIYVDSDIVFIKGLLTTYVALEWLEKHLQNCADCKR